MANYKLSYLKYGCFESVDLTKLECLKEKKINDIETLDEFTTSFPNEDELLDFLKRNKIINDAVKKLYITLEKTVDGNKINKKVFNGDILLFNNDIKYLKISFIYNWILCNKNKTDYIIKISDNYLNKYRRAYKENENSYIISLFSTLKHLALIIKNNEYIDKEVLTEFEECISEFINFEFYKTEKVSGNGNKPKRKKDNNGNYIKNYRNIHDFVILIKSIDKYLNKELDNNRYNSNISLFDNSDVDIENVLITSDDEFLTYEDYKRTNKQLVDSYEERMFIPYRDGNDWIVPTTKNDLEESLDEYAKKLLKK